MSLPLPGPRLPARDASESPAAAARVRPERAKHSTPNAATDRGDCGPPRSRLLLTLLLGALALLGVSLTPAAERAAAPPNIIILLADDLGYAELGCQGNTDIPTPHIDSLARNGIRFTQGYVTAPVCAPSRAGLMTGRYQTRFGHELNVIGRQNLDENIGLPLTEKTLADHLKAAGYVTGLLGKWHLGGTEKFHPQRRGFDEFYGFLHEGHFFVPPPYRGVKSFLRTNALPDGAPGPRLTVGDVTWTTHMRGSEPPYDADNPILRGAAPLVEPQYLTEAFTREALAFIDRHRERPFFLYLSYNAVHSPLQATLKDLARFPHIADEHRRIFAAMLASLDDSVGAVLARLRELQLEENTLVFFLSDNGGPTAELTSSNAPLRGGKGQLYEGGIRVPFLVQWKGQLPAGKVFEHPVISLDIFATALAAAESRAGPMTRHSGRNVQPAQGVPPSGGSGAPAQAGTPSPDGVNLLPFLRGEQTGRPHQTLFWRYGQNLALRHGDWKLVRQGGPGARAAGFQLFNLARDAAEETDLAAQQPNLARNLQARLEKLNAQMVPPLWGGAPKK